MISTNLKINFRESIVLFYSIWS